MPTTRHLTRRRMARWARISSGLALMLVGSAALAQDAVEPEAKPERELPPGVHRESLPHPDDPQRRVELYWAAPAGEGPWPAILYVHGHQFPKRPGAWRYVERGLLARTVADGFVAAGVSQPGYGASDGPPDFCGPASQQAVHAALARLRGLSVVDPERIVVYGYSRGSTVAAMVAAQDDSLAGVILGAGSYDLAAAYAWLDESDRTQAGIKRNIDHETGSTPAAFEARSALHADPPIRVPTLILHGEDDRNIPVAQALALEDRLRAAGTPVELHVFSGVAHGIPREKLEGLVRGFLERTVLDREPVEAGVAESGGG